MMRKLVGGAGGIRTLDRALQPYNGLANRRLQPLGHSSVVMNQALSSSVRWLKPRIATGVSGSPFLTCSQRRLDRLGRGLVGLREQMAVDAQRHNGGCMTD